MKYPAPERKFDIIHACSTVITSTTGGWTLFSPLFVCLFVCLFVSRISQKVVDGFGQNYVDRLSVSQERIDEILVKIQIQIEIL